MEDIDKRIDEYSGLFDLYIEGKPIPPEYKDDPVAGYIEEICQDSGNKELCRKEETWKEIFRKEIISMLEGILPVVSTIEREYEEEMKILSHFFTSNIEQKTPSMERYRQALARYFRQQHVQYTWIYPGIWKKTENY